jgi:hypothetical protein
MSNDAVIVMCPPYPEYKKASKDQSHKKLRMKMSRISFIAFVILSIIFMVTIIYLSNPKDYDQSKCNPNEGATERLFFSRCVG